MQDILGILAYVRENGSEAAALHVETGLLKACRKLAAMPGIGHRREDYTAGDLRFYTIWSYYIVYRPDTDPLEIVRVIHAARDIAALIDEIT